MGDVLAGRVAVITGSGRGQGLAAALRFAEEGASVVVNDLDETTVKSAVDQVLAAGGRAAGAVGDVSEPDDVQAMLRVAKDEFAGLDILYNNAGIGFSAKARMDIAMDDIRNCTIEDWDRILAINLRGVFLCSKFAIPMLEERGGGVIINTASIAALRGGPRVHAYSVSKAGVINLTRCIASAYGHLGIRCNAILPGLIDTDMVHDTVLATEDARQGVARRTPLGRVGAPEDVAETALFLASDAASFLTGQAIAVDGGLTA
jgi:NAD(P)-dependent dehydrogenase (short-subunit alcohol dehydrogenase family)